MRPTTSPSIRAPAWPRDPPGDPSITRPLPRAPSISVPFLNAPLQYESEIEGLKERLHAAERQLEDEQRQVANLQALQALEGSWQTSGNVLDLQERIEELQRQNGALELDQIRWRVVQCRGSRVFNLGAGVNRAPQNWG